MYKLRDRGRELAVEAWAADGRQHARLLVDGRDVGEKAVGALEDARFDLGETAGDETVRQRVKVKFLWGGRVSGCDLLETPAGEDWPRRPSVTPFVPPEGTRARKRHDLRERHPNIYAMRHVAQEAFAIMVGLLGISALLSVLFGRLLPSIDWSWLPDLDRPDWLRYLNPAHWIKRLWPDNWSLPDIPLPDLPDLPDLPELNMGWLKYAVPLLIALGVALNEIDRRRKRREREERFDRPSSEEHDDVGH